MIRTLSIEEVGGLIGKAPRTVREDMRRRPNTLPPFVALPGSKKQVFLEATVLEWLTQFETRKRSKA